MEITANAVQTVAPNQHLLFTDLAVGCSGCQIYREGSGLVTLRGNTNTQNRVRYKLSFGGNVAIPTGGTAEPISLAFAINGEPIYTSTMISTPSAVAQFNNVANTTYVDVPRGCCFEASIRNLSTSDIEVSNANFIVERVA